MLVIMFKSAHIRFKQTLRLLGPCFKTGQVGGKHSSRPFFVGWSPPRTARCGRSSLGTTVYSCAPSLPRTGREGAVSTSVNGHKWISPSLYQKDLRNTGQARASAWTLHSTLLRVTFFSSA